MNPYYQPAIATPVAQPIQVGTYDPSCPVSTGKSFPTIIPRHENEATSFLTSQGWPVHMQKAFLKNLSKVAIRIFLCDDSGSMGTEDGKTLVKYQGKAKSVQCSRWKELTTALQFHLELAHQGGIPTEFRFLNAFGNSVPIGFDDDSSLNGYNQIKSLLTDGSCSGGTPLCRHIREVTEMVRAYESQLRANGQVVCLVIATDGEASDGNVGDVLRPLKDLPVWIVLRFCTDDEKVINYWNQIESELELNMDVLDDFFGEAEEIHGVNPWLTYGEQIHRMREFGVTLKELDKIDEKLLSADEMLKVCKMCVGPSVDSFPHPQVDIKSFLKEMKAACSLEPKIYNPVKDQMTTWIDLQELKKCYSTSSGGCVLC